MRKNNPFSELGITPEIAKAIPVNELGELLKTHYRLLAKFTHPDRKGGDTKSFQHIQGAYDALSDPEIRAGWLAELKKSKAGGRHRAQLETVEKELSEAQQRTSLLTNHLRVLWQSQNGRTVLETDRWGTLATSLFPTQRVSILVFETAEGSLLARSVSNPFVSYKINRRLFDKRTFELTVERGGEKLTRQNLKRFEFEGDEEIPTGTPENWIFRRGGKGSSQSFYWVRVGRKTTLPGKLVGCLGDTEVARERGERESRLNELLPAQPQPEDFERIRSKGFPWEMFAVYLHAITPAIVRRQDLVAIRYGRGGEMSFHLLGRVNAINIL